MKRVTLFIIVFFMTAALLPGCAGRPASGKKTAPSSKASSTVSSAASSSHADENTDVTFLAAGDNILHEAVYKDAQTPAGYDFSPIYSNITSEIHKADFAFVNQEGPIGGTSLGLEGYPLFNGPQEAGTALVKAGFNLISQANNHAMDFGFSAIANTCAFWKAQSGTVMSGMYASEQDSESIPVLTKKGVRVALIAYSWSLNGISYPVGKDWCVETNFSDVLGKVKQARTEADVVVVSAHWGEEYHTQADTRQKSEAQQLADAGADIIIGNHPHVIETPAWIQASDGRRVLCAYAMGNLVSSQTEFENVIGGLLEFTVTKSTAGISVHDARFVPVVTHFTKGYHGFRVYLLSDYTDALAHEHGISDAADVSPAHIKSFVKSVVSTEFYDG